MFIDCVIGGTSSRPWTVNSWVFGVSKSICRFSTVYNVSTLKPVFKDQLYLCFDTIFREFTLPL